MITDFLDLGFEKCFYVKDMRSIAGQFTKNNRCGIYILHFATGQYYVGLAVDVVNRYAQHRQNHLDIEYISFKEVARTNLAKVEKETVYKLEDLNKSLRNINIVSIVSGDTDLDLIVSKEEQNKWITEELEIESLQTKRFEYPQLRQKYTAKFEKLSKNELIEEIKECLRIYVLGTIPFPRLTEYSFWSLSCLPSTHPKTIARLNIYWQETLVLFQYELDTDIQTDTQKIGMNVSIWLAKSILEKTWTETRLKEKFISLSYENWNHESGGQDQQCITIESVEFSEFLLSEGIFEAVKAFNLRLMQKGGCIWNRYHCFDLADIALDTSFLTTE